MGHREAARRATRQMERIADEIRRARGKLGLSRRELARRSRVARSTLERIEDGRVRVQLDRVFAVASAAGLDLVLNAYPAPGVRLRDTGQMTIAEQIVRVAAHAWRPVLEARAGDKGHAVDLLLVGQDELLDVEIERRIEDFQSQYRHARWKRDLLAEQHQAPVRLILVIEDTRRNRAVVEPHLSLIRSQLPASPRAILTAVRTGRLLGADGLLWLRRRKTE